MSSPHPLRARVLKIIGAILALAILGAILLTLAGTFRDQIEPGPTQAHGTTAIEPGSTVEEVLAVDVPLVERFPGTVQAIRDAVIAPRITAQVLEVSCRAGDHVKTGDLLVTLDARDLEAQAAQARESLAAEEANADDARSTLKRMETVVAAGRGAVSEREIDSARSQVTASEANVERAKRRLDEAQIGVGFAGLSAPFDAVIIDRYVEPGDIATVGQPACRLYDPSRMRLEVFVRESLAVGLHPGDAVEVELAALGANVPGTVEEIVPQAEPGSRTLLVKVALNGVEGLYPGLFGRLRLQSGERASVRVPEASVHTVGQLRFVVLEDGARRHVTVGRSADGAVEVLSGLAPGERIRVPAR